MRHAVLDTNILVSALLRPTGPPGLVMAAVGQGKLRPVVNAEILAEYEEVLRRPRLKLDGAKVEAAVALLRAEGQFVPGDTPAPPTGLPDLKDWPFMACALAVACPVVTGNVKHFPAGMGVRVMTAREWVDERMGFDAP